jgi:hypothetical protein
MDPWGNAYIKNETLYALGVNKIDQESYGLVMFGPEQTKFPAKLRNVPVRGIQVKSVTSFNDDTLAVDAPQHPLVTVEDHFESLHEKLQQEMSDHLTYGEQRELLDQDEDDLLDYGTILENEFYQEREKTAEELEAQQKEGSAQESNQLPQNAKKQSEKLPKSASKPAESKPLVEQDPDPNLPYRNYQPLYKYNEAKRTWYDEDSAKRKRAFPKLVKYLPTPLSNRPPPKVHVAHVMPTIDDPVTIKSPSESDTTLYSGKVISVAAWAKNAPPRIFNKVEDDQEQHKLLTQYTSYQLPPDYDPEKIKDDYHFPAKFRSITEDMEQLENEVAIARDAFVSMEGAFVVQLDQVLPATEHGVYKLFDAQGKHIVGKIVTTLEADEGHFAVVVPYRDVFHYSVESYVRDRADLPDIVYENIPEPAKVAFESDHPAPVRPTFEDYERERLMNKPPGRFETIQEYFEAIAKWKQQRYVLGQIQQKAADLYKTRKEQMTQEESDELISQVKELKKQIPKSLYIENERMKKRK